jgi:hydroxymethylbilane synthase
MAAHATLEGGRLVVDGLVGRPDGTLVLRDRVEGPSADAAGLGVALAERLIARGADAVLRNAGG